MNLYALETQDLASRTGAKLKMKISQPGYRSARPSLGTACGSLTLDFFFLFIKNKSCT